MKNSIWESMSREEQLKIKLDEEEWFAYKDGVARGYAYAMDRAQKYRDFLFKTYGHQSTFEPEGWE